MKKTDFPALRVLRLARLYPKAFLASLALRLLPATRSMDPLAWKAAEKAKGGCVGWAVGDKIVCGLRLREGEELTAEHFYFSRSLKPLKTAIPLLQRDGIRFSGTLAEHGCGTARYLHYLKDRFGMDAVGYDIYLPAVRVANQFPDTPVHCLNMLEHEIAPCDLLFFSSYLGHIMHLPGFDDYLSRAVKAARQIIAMEPDNPALRAILERFGFTYRNYGFFIKT